jgi:hypothetical protein
VDWLRIDGAVAELYDLAVISGPTCPMAASPGSPDSVQLITFEDAASKPGVEAPPTPPEAQMIPFTTVAQLRGSK